MRGGILFVYPSNCVSIHIFHLQVTCPGFIPRLYELFTIAEDLEVLSELQIIYEVFMTYIVEMGYSDVCLCIANSFVMSLLFLLLQIFLSLMLLNDTALFDLLLSEDNIMQTVACLEYHPKITPQQDGQKHRKFLQKYAVDSATQ